MTVVINRGAPMVDHIIGFTPDLTAGKFASPFADFVKTGTDTITGGTED